MHGPRGHRPSTAPITALALVAVALLAAACSGVSATPSSSPTVAGPAPTKGPTPTPAATAPEADRPAPRTASAMTWDPTSGTVLLFGGTGASGALGDLWSWDGVTWTRQATTGPTPRDGALLVADPERHTVVLIGGRSGTTVHDDTWTWDGSGWTKVTAPGPPARTHAAAAFDQASKRVLLYGGVSTDDVELHDTWAWDGSAWTKLDDAGIPGRAPDGMAFDPAAGLPLLLAVDLAKPDAHDAYPSSVWGWDGSAWYVMGKTGPAFSPVQSFVETAGHPQLLDGGVVSGELALHAWTGDGWTTLATGGPAVRNGQAAGYDPVRDRLVLFGGFAGDTTYGDTWEFDGTTWHQVQP